MTWPNHASFLAHDTARTIMDFPVLRDSQHAVLACEVQTGIVLSLDGMWWLSDEPAECWRVFDTLAAAREFAVAEVARIPAIEFSIYDRQAQWVERIVR